MPADQQSDSSTLESPANESTSTRVQRKHAVTGAIKLLPKLIEASNWGQSERQLDLSRQIAEILAPHHHDLSQSIYRKIGDIKRLSPIKLHKPENLVSFEQASHGLENLILTEETQKECLAIINEHAKSQDLAKFDLRPRHRVLLHGAPGNGKTLLAEALAYHLDVPFLRVKYGGLIDSHLGASAKNIDSLMEYASSAPCLVFADEFDGVGISRADARDIGEARRITNQLLIALERLPSHTVFVAATNSPDLMDKALLRRFDFVVHIPSPTPNLIHRCAKAQLATNLTPGHDISDLADRIVDLKPSSLYATVELCKRLRRDLVLNGGVGLDAILQAAPDIICDEK